MEIDNLTTSQKADVIESIMPPGIVPVEYRVLWALLIMVILGGATLFTLYKHGVTDPSVLIWIPGGVLFICWIFFVIFDVIPGWTVLVAVLSASAFIGFKFYQNRGYVGL